MSYDVEVAIVGGGQAGLSTSWYLKQAGVEHVVLEAERIAETWRSRRWDSFCLVTPNSETRLPGAPYEGPDPDGFLTLTELVDYFEGWVGSFRPEVKEQCPVDRLEVEADGSFSLRVPDGRIRARTVVVATGAFQKAHRPAGAETLPTWLNQVLAEDYGSPDRLPPGNVLIVGSGQTGCQLAEELHEAGRKVVLACGRCGWIPRRTGDQDTVTLMHASGFADRTPEMVAWPAVRLFGNPQATGHHGGRDLHFRTLHRDGVELVGRFLGADGDSISFADDLAASVDFGDARWADLRAYIDRHLAKNGLPIPDHDIPPPMRISTRQRLDVKHEGITSVIWTSGYRPEYGWVKADVFDDAGFPVQKDGRSSVPGLYFVGVHWMRKQKSAILYGVGEDAEIVVNDIAGRRS